MVSDSTPRVESITPSAAIPGGEIAIRGEGFAASNNTRPRVMFGDTEAGLLIAAKNYLVARVPEGAAVASVRVATSHGTSPAVEMQLGVQIAENLNPVANPAVDGEGNIYVTYSGQRGQKVPVSLYKITANYQVKPFATELVNPTGLALDHAGVLYVSCRNDGTIHRVTPDGRSQLWVEGMGIATGIAFDAEKNLFVGDRSGTIFKISPDRQIFVFATLEPSIAAYHLAFSPAGELYVAGPTTSSYDRIVRINRQGEGARVWRLIAKEIFTSRPPSTGGAESPESRRTARRKSCSAAWGWSDWPFCLRGGPCWPPIARFSVWTGISKAWPSRYDPPTMTLKDAS